MWNESNIILGIFLFGFIEFPSEKLSNLNSNNKTENRADTVWTDIFFINWLYMRALDLIRIFV